MKIHMQYIKLQVGCLIIVLYLALLYLRECKIYKIKRHKTMFDKLLAVGIVNLIFDAATAYSVNNLDKVPAVINGFLHICFLISLDVLMFMFFLYMLSITEGTPKKKYQRRLLYIPLIVNIVIVMVSMPSLEYRTGKMSNYSMGIPAYTCYTMVIIYIAASLIMFHRHWNYIEGNKRISILTYLTVVIGVSVYQMLVPDILITALTSTIIVMGVYMNQEDPAFARLSQYHDEMIMGFATLVENKDDSTGGHIKRTTAYVELISKELRAKGIYKDELTRDYRKNLVKAAPMHDIGKISIPDAILQKPGRLAPEEFEVMKTHAARGGKIIRDTFGNMEDGQYQDVAFQVARYHHEKWNGKGYPEGLSGKEIPLSARIMAVADVFDAVSAKRCYRDAMPLEQCFQIIADGSGQDFDPVIAKVFLSARDEVEKICTSYRDAENN